MVGDKDWGVLDPGYVGKSALWPSRKVDDPRGKGRCRPAFHQVDAAMIVAA